MSVPQNLTEEIVEAHGIEGLQEMRVNLEKAMIALSGLEDALVGHMLSNPKSVYVGINHSSIAIH